MSVLKSKRGESSAEFLELARKLQAETLDYALKLPKRLTFFLSTEIMRWGHEVYNNVKAGNSIFLAKKSDAEKRRDHWIEANNAIQVLDGKVSLAYDALMRNPERFAENEKDPEKRAEKIRKGKARLDRATASLTALMNETASQIKKIKDSDASRARKLPD